LLGFFGQQAWCMGIDLQGQVLLGLGFIDPV